MTRTEQIKQFEHINRRFEARYFPRVRRAIHSQVRGVIEQLRTGGYAAAERYLLSNVGNPAMEKVIRDLYIKVGRRWAQLTYSRLLPDLRGQKHSRSHYQQKGFGFNYTWTQFIINYLERFLLEKITFDIANTTRNALLRALAAATAAGWSIDQTVDRLEDWPFERYQAARIVRTETNRAANVGSKAQAETSEYQQVKEWMSANDNRVRGNPVNGKRDHANHWDLNGVKVDENDVFKDPRNGDLLEFPGDPKASAASTVNCRCHASFTFKRDANGNLIPKRKTTTVIFPGQQRRPRQVVTI